MQASKCPEGTKPMLVFAGEAFDLDNDHKRLKSLLIGGSWCSWVWRHSVLGRITHQCAISLCLSVLLDFFRGPTVSAVRLAGLEHVLHFTAVDGKIFLRSYRYRSTWPQISLSCIFFFPWGLIYISPPLSVPYFIAFLCWHLPFSKSVLMKCGVFRSLLKKSGCRTPRIELEEIGPSFDFVLRRSHLASDDLYKLAHKQPKALKVSHSNTPYGILSTIYTEV